MNTIKNILVFILIWGNIQLYAQHKNNASYEKVITERANKIVRAIDISDTAKSIIVQNIIVQQYKKLNDYHEVRNTQLKTIAKENTKPVADSLIKIYTSDSETTLSDIHNEYIETLRKQLSKKQVEGVKNGMTYHVFPNTWRAYQEMMPDLKRKHKKQIYHYLYEAREHAMDAESSEKKHAWFGKYKGKINNYLTAEGINMKEVSTAWEKRIRAAEEAKKKTEIQNKQ